MIDVATGHASRQVSLRQISPLILSAAGTEVVPMVTGPSKNASSIDRKPLVTRPPDFVWVVPPIFTGAGTLFPGAVAVGEVHAWIETALPKRRERQNAA